MCAQRVVYCEKRLQIGVCLNGITFQKERLIVSPLYSAAPCEKDFVAHCTQRSPVSVFPL